LRRKFREELPDHLQAAGIDFMNSFPPNFM
jgi:hypothetical protein